MHDHVSQKQKDPLTIFSSFSPIPSKTPHKYAKCLKWEVKRLVGEMTTSMVLPRNNLMTLNNRNGRSATTNKHIYNARHKYKQSIRGPR
jgi:hypothetical protein